MMRRTAVHAGAAVAAALLLASCGSDAATGGSPGRSGAPSTTVEPTGSPSPLGDRFDIVEFDPDTAPADFLARASLPSCGSYVVRLLEPVDADAARCVAAASGSPRGAELTYQQRTVEGDPIITYLRVKPRGAGIEVYRDDTRDAFGARVWTRSTCTGFDAANVEATGCTQQAAYLNGDITGRWVPQDIDDFTFTKAMRDREQFAIELHGDGTWSGSDGCNAIGGTYAAQPDGAFRATAGPQTLIGCANVPTSEVLASATSVVLESDRLRFLGPPLSEPGSEQLLAIFVRGA